MFSSKAHPEARLIQLLRKRDEAAFNELVLTYEAQVYRLAFRMLGSPEDARDLCQEVFVQVFRSIENFRGDSKLSTWLFRITVNLSKNQNKYLARRQKKNHSELDEALGFEAQGASGVTSGEMPAPEEQAVGRQIERIVKEALNSLDEEHRTLVILRDIEGLSYEEVAEIAELPIGTLKSRLHRARATLRQKIEAATGEVIR
ncbi:MAG: hypothetical protein B6A08_10560 [Sorangiineae bacterium NIC37A_2]|jgi:RNA polymerase sigma-70 factor (ECF subfamily)|nr:MAG: hypothetical protein B6A08_10560 [Sorangiineae bacterium NIC37A_2]